MAYHPETKAFYVPLTPGCARSVFGAMPEPELGGGGVGPNDRRFVVHPDPEQLGDFLAMDTRTGELLWRRRSPWQYETGVLTTRGGLVFVGDIDRYMYAFDARDGTELWRTRTPTATDGSPSPTRWTAASTSRCRPARAGASRGGARGWRSPRPCSVRRGPGRSWRSSRFRWTDVFPASSRLGL